MGATLRHRRLWRSGSAVRWGIAGNIVVAWLVTIPCAAIVGAGAERLTRLPAGRGITVAVAAVIGATAFYAQRRRRGLATAVGPPRGADQAAPKIEEALGVAR